jgi:hypothetical protein
MAQLRVSLMAQISIGIAINKELIIEIFVSSRKQKYKTIGIGATDQKGSYKLEFLWIILPI